MAPQENPPRPWYIDDLLDLGRRQGEKGNYLKALPVLILEKWVQEKREEESANYVWTKQLARRLEKCGLVPAFKPKATGGIFGSLTTTQKHRNLTRPPLIEYQGKGMSRVNLPHYEPLLQEYRQKYSELYPEDYEKLYPEGEPDWEPPILPKARAKRRKAVPMLAESEVQDEIQHLLEPVEQVLRDQQQALDRLIKEKQKLQSEFVALNAALQEKRNFPRPRIIDEELESDCAEFLKRKETYIDAIRRAGVILEERLRKTMGGDGGKFLNGKELIDYALTPNSGKLIISENPSEQEGVRMLFRGALQFVRNPPSHKKLQYAEAEALQAINLVDFLLQLLNQVELRDK
jgi:uncharacterized protein (TIGR02391 family)